MIAHFRFALFVFFFLISSLAQGQKFDWARKFESTGISLTSHLDMDKHGNIYTEITVFSYNSTFDFDLGPSVAQVNNTNAFTSVLAKYDSLGNMIWYLPFETDSVYSIEIEGVKVTNSDEFYLSLSCQGIVDVDPGPGTAIVTTPINVNNLVLCKFSSSGSLIWYKQFVRSGGIDLYDTFNGMDLDQDENIVVGGRFYGNIDLDPSVSTASFISSFGTSNAFIAKYSPLGDYLFGYGFGASQNDRVTDISIDTNNNIVAVGYFYGTVDFDPSSAVNSLIASFEKPFILKLANNGSFKWVKTHGSSSGAVFPLKVKTDQNNNLIIGGHCKGVTNLATSPASYPIAVGNTSFDVYLQKLDSTGSFLWAHRFGNTASDQLSDLVLDSLNNIYVTGYLTKAADMDASSSIYPLPSLFNFNKEYIYIAKYLSNGQIEWAKDIRGNGGSDIGKSIMVNKQFQVYSFSQFTDSVDVNTDEDTLLFEVTAGYPISTGVFMHRIAPCQISRDTIQVTNCGPYTSPSGKYVWTTSGSYSDVLRNHLGCDSILSIQLTITQLPIMNLAVSGCNSYTSPFSGNTYTQIGTQQEVINHPTGCDTLVNLSISFLQSIVLTNVSACQSYTSPSGNVYTQNGYYYDTLINQYGCDSIIRTNLQILDNVYDTLVLDECASYSSPSSNFIWNQSGVYYDTISWAGGCQKFYTIYLTILPVSNQLVSANVCDSYTTPTNLNTYTQSGVYTETLSNAFGCDSVVIYDLTFHYSNYGLQTLSSCNPITSPSGQFSYTQTGNYYDTIQNVYGCDSIIITDFTLNSTQSNIISISECDAYISPSGTQIWTQSGLYQDTLTNVLGCDSIVHIDLTIIPGVDTVVIIPFGSTGLTLQNAGLATYTWYECSSSFPVGNNAVFTPSQAGYYFVVSSYFICQDTSACYPWQISTAGLLQSDQNELQVFPNPVSSLLTIELPEMYLLESLRIVQMDGKVLKQIEVNTPSVSISVADLENGTYVLEIGNRRVKFIKIE